MRGSLYIPTVESMRGPLHDIPVRPESPDALAVGRTRVISFAAVRQTTKRQPDTPNMDEPPSSASSSAGEPEDAELMALASSGDVGAFDALVGRRWKGTFLYAYHLLGDLDQASDVAQEAFVRLWERRSFWDESRPVGAWLIRTTRNLVISDRRKWKVRMQWSMGIGTQETRRPRTPLQETEASEVRVALDEAIQTLAPRRREVFVLFHQQNFSYREIAETMGIRQQSVANHLQLATADLRKAMSRFFPGRAAERQPDRPPVEDAE